MTTLSSEDEYFNKIMELYKKCSKNEVLNGLDVHLEIPEESQQAFKELVKKLPKLRAKIKH